ncbi:arylsulfatase A-like enzyme [Dyadobacter jejuensis]|uniref:Arylsulfatase A-like enzyme n=1 Tax=Dyadobacter jejuensis TaxID=1082580 RepID=A0A316AJU3_9BACT|nr:sulfatase-like hydrolase/transferase [Dyadobacter jejuensis]PWJ58033.1 arylsulfatase A-like enzyme [Dyadobacter jejuensis]
MQFRISSLSLLVLSISLLLGQQALAQSAKPNIIFILTDDQPYGLMGCVGDPLTKTPHIDKMTSEGVLFTNYHITSAICTPSRVSMFLGEYERKHGVNFNSGTSVSPQAWQDSYSSVLRSNGYFTGYIGKNHMPIGDGGYESGHMEQSFDYWYAGHEHLGFYPKKRHPIFKYAQHDTQVEILDEGIQDFFADNTYNLKGALHFLEKRPNDQPFALTVAFNLPHDAGTRSMELLPGDSSIYRTLYRDLDIPLPKNYVARADIKNPKLPAELLHAQDRQEGYNWVDNPEDFRERTIRKMEVMTGIDGLIGNLRQRLAELNLDKNTIIIFTSDHGLFSGQYGLGGKALNYEVVTHVPLLIYNPTLPKSRRGIKSDALVQSIDLAPTMLKWAGIAPPKGYQGYDIGPLLLGAKSEVRDYVFTENLWSTAFGNPRIEAVQNKEWKYIRYYKNNNPSATQRIEVAKQLNININTMLYGVHDPDIAVYRSYVEAPFQGEKPVYEELYQLSKDPDELVNRAKDTQQAARMNELRKVCDEMVRYARGTEAPRVLRYTVDSVAEHNMKLAKKQYKEKALIKDDH